MKAPEIDGLIIGGGDGSSRARASYTKLAGNLHE